MKQHDWLQSALAFASGAVAYYLWTVYRAEVQPAGLLQAVTDMKQGVAAWVHGVRRAF